MTLTILDSGSVDSLTTGSGDAGTIIVTADTALLDGRGDEGFAGIITSSLSESGGEAGNITLAIDDLTMRNDAEITSSSTGTGNAGDVLVTSETITIDDERSDGAFITGISTSVQLTEGTDPGEAGDAGAIVIIADQLTLSGDESEVVSANDGAGLAGTIDIRLKEGLVLDNGADIFTVSESGGGGGISINAGSYVTATGPGADIATTVADDTGDAGDILIETPVLALGDSQIFAQAEAGSGGDIQISVDDLILSPAADINAEAGATGVDGTVALSSPETDVSGGLVAFEERFLNVSSLLRERCAARREDVGSSFTLGTGGALPADLDAPRLSLLQALPEKAREERAGQQTILVLPCPKAAS